jgi:SAM-dependent methyltransferase
LLEKGILHRYIAIDISEEMLHIAGRNIKEWFGDSVQFEGHVRDITFERFDDLLVDDMLDKNAEETINLALLLGATPMNFQAPYDLLKVIYSSLGHDDLLIYTDKPDTEADRRYFAVNADPGASALSAKYSFIFDLLNIDESLYDVEMGFNVEQRVRYIRVRLKVALTIKFEFENGERNVKFDKGDTILLWRAWHQTALELISEFDKTGFTLLQSSLTKDRQYFLSISGVEAKEFLES